MDERKFETTQVKLTPEEILKAAAELAAAEKELQAAREERKAATANIAARMTTIAKRIAILTDEIFTGTRSVEVEVLRILKPGEPFARIIEASTSKLVRTEPLGWLEQQESLRFEPPNEES